VYNLGATPASLAGGFSRTNPIHRIPAVADIGRRSPGTSAFPGRPSCA